MSIRQLNASYVAEEDRVMLRFTTLTNEEYRLWLTRAVVGGLLLQTEALAVKKLTHNHNVPQAQAVAQFKQQALRQEATYTQFEGAARLPLGAEPTLVKAVQAGMQEGVPMLVLQLARGQQLTLRLSEDLLGKLQLLMQKMNESARWALTSMPEAAGAPQLEQAPHLTRLAGKDLGSHRLPGQAASTSQDPSASEDELLQGSSTRKLLH